MHQDDIWGREETSRPKAVYPANRLVEFFCE